MKSLIAISTSLLLCGCADMYVTGTAGTGGAAGAIDPKDFGSGVHMITNNCGVGAYAPRAIYIRPFCIDTAVVQGNVAHGAGEIPIQKAIMPHEMAEDLKQQLEKIAPARILKDNESPRVGWVVDGHFNTIDGGHPGRSYMAMHIRITDVPTGTVVYEMDVAGGDRGQGAFGTLRAAGMGRQTHFDFMNASERVYLALSANPYKYGQRSDTILPE
jgi:hypothetical protein